MSDEYNAFAEEVDEEEEFALVAPTATRPDPAPLPEVIVPTVAEEKGPVQAWADIPNRDVLMKVEMSVLGGILIGSVASQRRDLARITPQMFWRPAHRMIAKAYLSLHQRGIKIDWLTLLPELGEEGLKSCGGEDYILQLVEVVPSAASTPFYIESLSRFAALAYIKARAKQIDRMVTEQKPLEEVVEAYQKPLSIGAGTRLRKLSDVDATKRDTGVTTGFSQLDRLISTKGYPSGQVTVVRARHKGGKSAFMIGSARAMCDRGAKVLYMTVADLNAVRLKQRMTRNICGFSTLESAMEEGTEADVESVRRALRQIERYSIHVYDGSKVDGGHEVETVCASIIEAVNEYGIEAVFIDYAQKLATRQHFRGNGTAEQDYICAMVSRTAERMGVATVVASQITVDKATGQVTTKNSRKWEEDCGWLLSVRQDSVEVSLSRFGPDTARNTELGKPAVGAAYRFNEERLRLDMI